MVEFLKTLAIACIPAIITGMEHYSDDIGSDDWVLLENILG